MLNLGRLAHLSRAIGVDRDVIMKTLDDFDVNPESVVHELTLWPANPKKKPRDVISIQKNWRLIQNRLYTRVFLPRFTPSRHSHGGVKRRSPRSNARVHLGNKFAYATDISNFFPSISCNRVNRLFLNSCCSYEVSRVLTRLCTYEFHLALGLVTSPILANQVFKEIDKRIAHACRARNLRYSRFMDDLTISGNYDLAETNIHEVVSNIVQQRHGFHLNLAKTHFGAFSEGLPVTGIRIKADHLDAPREYVDELERQINDHQSLSENGKFQGPLFTESELYGKSFFIFGLNQGRRRMILGKLKALNWEVIYRNATDRGLMLQRNRLSERNAIRPDANELPPNGSGILGNPSIEEPSDDARRVAPF